MSANSVGRARKPSERKFEMPKAPTPIRVKTIEYAMTVTLKPYWYTETITQQFDTAVPQILQFLEAFKAEGLMTAELTKTANIHFHGIFTFNVEEHELALFKKLHAPNFFRRSKVLGFLNLTPVTDQMGWIQYCLEEYDETKQCLRYNTKQLYDPIIFNQINQTLTDEFGVTKHKLYMSVDDVKKNSNIVPEEKDDVPSKSSKSRRG